jgi:hypothetical protein
MFNIFEPKPFKFEQFQTREEAQAYFDGHYLVGSDVRILLLDWERVGGKWEGGKKGEIEYDGLKEDFEYSGIYVGEYSNNIISWAPLERYDYVITIYTDDEDKIIETYVEKYLLCG